MSTTAEVIERSCTSKTALFRRDAAHAARQHRNRGEKVSVYRCPFADDHEDPSKRFHVGHAPKMSSLESIALEIRRRQGYDVHEVAS